MADVRSLLRSHQQSSASSRIAHPLAAYNAAGTLRCLACGIAVQPRVWEGHIVSKAHRKRAAAIRVEQERKGKRKEGVAELAQEEEGRGEKRRRVQEEEEEDVDMQDEQASPPAANGKGGFPAGFFSDPSRAPPPRETTPEEEEVPQPPPAAAAPPTLFPPPTEPSAPAAEPTALDLEFDSFLRDVLAPPPSVEEDAFARATVFAEPELAAPELPQGFPSSLAPQAAAEPSAPAAPVRRAPNRTVQTATGEAPREVEETEEEKRARKEQEEKELIMDRILDEERAQEEADERVESLKARLEAMKKARREKMGKKGT